MLLPSKKQMLGGCRLVKIFEQLVTLSTQIQSPFDLTGLQNKTSAQSALKKQKLKAYVANTDSLYYRVEHIFSRVATIWQYPAENKIKSKMDYKVTFVFGWPSKLQRSFSVGKGKQNNIIEAIGFGANRSLFLSSYLS